MSVRSGGSSVPIYVLYFTVAVGTEAMDRYLETQEATWRQCHTLGHLETEGKRETIFLTDLVLPHI